MLGMQGGLRFDDEEFPRDVAWLGNCDDGCLELADELGWSEELKEMCKKEHDKIDKENVGDKTKDVENVASKDDTSNENILKNK